MMKTKSFVKGDEHSDNNALDGVYNADYLLIIIDITACICYHREGGKCGYDIKRQRLRVLDPIPCCMVCQKQA